VKIALLHLSDIHFRTTNNYAATRAEHIARALGGIEAPFDSCIIAVSGDIAFSGRQEEYNVAYEFFDALRRSVSDLGRGPVFEVFIPGNHDCSLPDEEIRSRLHDVQGVLKDVAAANGTGSPDP
jgi:3',5'-cyclic AMP phosphodiesterase CpdA